jgi:DNA polymerase (family 10)
MAAAAKALGYEYLAITDHSKAMAMTNGLSPERLAQAHRERPSHQRQAQGDHAAGRERGRHPRGRADGLRGRHLKELDIVVASPHVSLKQDAKKATDRLLRAIDNKYVNIIGHPTGRLINGRAGLPLEMDKIIKAAADSGTALEINAGYPRPGPQRHQRPRARPQAGRDAQHRHPDCVTATGELRARLPAEVRRRPRGGRGCTATAKKS